MYLISPDKKQFKANLHCHSVLSDGKKTPEELKEMYKNKGYSILCISDHERPVNHSDLTDEDFLLLTGYEAYIRYQPSFNPFQPEIHLNLFAKKADNVKYVCYNKDFCKYLPEAEHDTLDKVGSERKRELTTEYVNEFIKTANDNGYLVSYNHSYWSMVPEEQVLAYEGIFSLEVFNYDSDLMSGLENGTGLYNKLTNAGKKLFCHAADDNHNCFDDDGPLCDSFGAFTMIMSDDLNYDSVISAMETGEMYASMGPEFKEISLNGRFLHIECSPVKHFYVYCGGKKTHFYHARPGKTLTAFDVAEIYPEATFLRIAIVDENGNFATTRVFSKEELGL